MKYFFGILLLLAASMTLSGQTLQIKKNRITFNYNKAKGTYSIGSERQLFINQAVSYVRLANGQKISTDKLTGTRSVTEKPVQDNLGKGIRYTISVKAGQGITLLQHFYFYDTIDGVILEMEVRGKNIASNELVPIWS
ncbi:hypothetical protein, partial [Sphingobacterium athyrii]